jgi:hypothetical protein
MNGRPSKLTVLDMCGEALLGDPHRDEVALPKLS